MLASIARLATTRPRAILIAACSIMVLGGLFGAAVLGQLRTGGYTADSAESARAARYLDAHFPGANPNLILRVATSDGVESEPARRVGTRVADQLRNRPDVSGVESYWSARPDLASALRSNDSHSALIFATIAGDETDAPKTAREIARQVSGEYEGVTVTAGGSSMFFADMLDQSTRDLALAEAVAIPVSAIALVLVFGSVVAAAMPLVIGVFSIVVTSGVLWVLTQFTDVSLFALNMTSVLGLALAIDYSLFIVNRYREELATGIEPAEAVIQAVRTAGRTVLFSAATVALATSALLVFPSYFLRSLAYACLTVVVVAAAAAVTVLPACLVLLAARIEAFDLRIPLRRWTGRTAPVTGAVEDSRWYRFAHAVMRRPIAAMAGVIALLLLLGAPFLSLRLGYPDDRVLPQSVSSRQVGDTLREGYGSSFAAMTSIVLPEYHGSTAELGDYASQLSQVDGVSAVTSAAGVYQHGARLPVASPPGMLSESGAYVSVFSDIDPYSRAATAQLNTLHAVAAPGPTWFGGGAQTNADTVGGIRDRLPLAAAIIVIATFAVLFVFTGSVVLPLKAIVLTVLSLTATFGAMVWVFQWGHLSGLLGFTPTGALSATIPVLMFCLAFGVSMDYEVFLLSRIREEWMASDRSPAANTRAVALGIARTGRIFTAAAILMSIALIALAGSKVSFMQLLGIGLTLAVLADATVVRAVLVPALMRVMGAANWWAPAPLVRLHQRIGLTEVPVPTRSAESSVRSH